LKPGGRVALILTRWHEDDLAGRLLEAEGGRWRVLMLPAIAGEADPLGRAAGEPLWADDGYGYGASLERIRATYEAAGATRDWASLYQQEPRPAEGAVFKVATIGALDAAPVEAAAAGARMVRAWDLAATSAAGTRDPDWTVGLLLARTPDKRLVVLDVARLRGGPEEVERAIVATAERDGRRVKVALPQDPGQAGKAQVAYLARRLMGWTVLARPETGAKATRAAPVASQCNVGNLAVVRAGWNRAFLEELADFPSGAHDDQVDALARAFAELDAPSYDTSMRWVTGGDPAAAADAMRRLDAQMNMMRFHEQRVWMFGR
jgi:predicted phage terminase large subunit-like protein